MTREVEKRCPAAGKQQAMDGIGWDGTGRDRTRWDAMRCFLTYVWPQCNSLTGMSSLSFQFHRTKMVRHVSNLQHFKRTETLSGWRK